ncbi:MAG: alanine racemase, partial [Candidatus Calescibacterium sp.]|nr:alanine racemase [Candidatus Calescibacterium sp.]
MSVNDRTYNMRVSRTTSTGVYINTSILRSNLNIIESMIPYKVISVLKSNAYGLGINNILPWIINDIYKVAINDVEEFFEFRLYNYPINFILFFPEIDENIIDDVIRYKNVEISVNSYEMLGILCDMRNKRIKAHLEVDTGMNRTGIRYDNKINIIENMELVGLYTHLKSDNLEDNIEQIVKFYEFIKNNHIDVKGLDISVLSSSGVMNYELLKKAGNYKVNFILGICNSVRVGILQYGIVPSTKYLGLKKVLNLQTCVKMEVGFLGSKFVKKGETIGYTGRYAHCADKDLRVGLAYLGYSKVPFSQNLCFDVVTDKRSFVTNSVGSMSMDVIAFDLANLRDDEIVKKIYLFSENIDIE